MFEDYDSEVAGFRSVPTVKRDVSENSTQTSEFHVKNGETQNVSTSHVSTQTEEDDDIEFAEFDVGNLSEFLQRIFPNVMKELDKIHGIPIGLDAIPDDVDISTLHVIPTINKLNICCLSWSCTGGILAVSNGYTVHDGQCIHSGNISLYLLKNLNVKTTPDYHIETQCFTTSLSWHPEQPSILAAGLYSGEIIVWNIQKDEETMLSTSKKSDVDGGHCDKVTGLAWIRDATRDTTRHLLLSVGEDGRIILWRVGISSNTLTILDQFLMAPNSISRTKVKDVEVFEKDTGLPISCLCSSQDIDNNLVISITKSIIDISVRPSENFVVGSTKYKHSVIYEYESHDGIVTGLQCVGNSGQFISASLDGQIRIYQFKKAEANLTISTGKEVLGAVTSPLLPDFIVYWSGCNVYFYNLKTQLCVDRATEDKQLVSLVSLNNIRKGIVAVGTMDGVIEVWSVSFFRKWN